MSIDFAIRLSEILLAFAYIVQSAEHIYVSTIFKDHLLFVGRLTLSILLLAGIQTPLVLGLIFLTSLYMLKGYNGPYNGGSDRMGLLILSCLMLTHIIPSEQWREYAFGYLAIQLVLSYFIAGWVKVVNREWRSGRALQDVFLFSAYPFSTCLKDWVNYPKWLRLMSWAVMTFELAFPFMLLTQETLILALIIAAIFHLANVYLFGLNRFFWVWIAAYPSLLWLQDRIF